MKRFFQKFFLYSRLPEMRLFWLFLVFGIILSVINFYYLLEFWPYVSTGMLLILGFLIIFNSLRLARTNLEIKVERNVLKSIIFNLRDGVMAYNTNFKMLIFNRAAEQIFNVMNSDIIGQEFSPNRAKEDNFRLLTQVMFPSLAPLVIKRSDVNIFPQISDFSFEKERIELRVTTDKIVDPNGQLLGFVKIIHDRTRELEILKSKTEFISVAAHQLRTPLSAVNWALENLTKEELNESQKEIVDAGLGAATKLLRIVNDLLDVSRMEEGRFGYKFEDLDIVNFLQETIIEVSELHHESSVKLYFEKPEKEQVVISADKEKLKLVLMNLLDNAVKYNVENGEVVVGLIEMKDKPFVEITIKDTGVGIPPEDIGKLFMKFFRSENVIKIVTEGTGLGIYIAKNIIKRHGGEIWVESELNRGTTFHFTLPTDSRLIPSKEIVYGEEN